MTAVSEPDLRRPDGSVIPAREVRRSLDTNILAGCLGMVWAAAAFGMPLTMLVEALGVSGVIIGLLTTIRQLAMMAQIPGAIFSGKITSRKSFWAPLVIVQRVLWVLPGFLPLVMGGSNPAVPWLILSTVALGDLFANFGSSAWWSWMGDLVPEQTSGRFWGRRQTWLTASNLVAVALMGCVLDWIPSPAKPGGGYWGFALVFAVAAIFGVLDIVVHLRVVEPAIKGAEGGPRLDLLAPLRDADFRWLTLGLGSWAFSVGLVGAFGIVYLKREFGISYIGLSAIGIASALGAVASGHAAGYLTDRLGARTLLAILMVVCPVSLLAWFLASPGQIQIDFPGLPPLRVSEVLVQGCVISFLAGSLYSAVIPCQLRLSAALAAADRRAIYMAVHWTVIGLVGALGPVLAGYLMDLVTAHPLPFLLPAGIPVGFFHVLILLHLASALGLAVPLILKIQAKAGDLPVGTALARIVVGNPLQAVRNVFNIYAMASSRRSDSRARAVRELGHQRTALAIQDLVERLDDPSDEVREEAVLALGNIGGPDAVDALLGRLGTGDGQMDPLIARALRYSGDGRCVPPLLRMLESKDRETIIESARTLGRLEDASAIPALVRIIKLIADERVLGACAVALGRLRDETAAPLLLQHYAAARSANLRRTLAIAVGDALGEPDEFYEVLLAETRAAGAGVEKLLGMLRRLVVRQLSGFRAEEKPLRLLEKLEATHAANDPHTCSAALQEFHQAFSESLEARSQGYARRQITAQFLRQLGERTRDTVDPLDFLLALYLIVQTCPVKVVSR